MCIDLPDVVKQSILSARCQRKSAAEVSRILKKSAADFESPPFRAKNYALYASQLTSEGSLYTRLLEVPFEE